MKYLLATTLVLLILQRSDGQATEYTGQLRPCDAVFTDNLSCQNNVDALDTNDCLNRTQICDGTNDCLSGTTPSQIDESIGFNSLDCNTMIYFCVGGAGGATIAELCNGVDDCGDGSDEVNIICENKCLFPYYGGCPIVRECITSESGRRCGSCLPGLTGGPFTSNPCFALVNLTLDASVYNTAEGMPIVQVTVSGSVPFGNLSIVDTTGQSFVVNLALSDGTATGGLDFLTVTPNLTFDFNNILIPQTVDITIVDDDLLEVTEDFDVSLNIVSGNDNSQIVFGISSATVSIADNDAAVFSFTETSYDVSEDAGPAVVTVELGGADLTFPINVTVETIAGGTATVGSDYSATSQVLTFGATSVRGATMDVSIPIVDDMFVEVTETINVTGSVTEPLASFQPSQTVVNILNDDVATFQLSPTTYTVNEDDGSVMVTVECIGATLTFDVEVTFKTVVNGSTATAGADYTAITTTLTFSAGATSGTTQTVTVLITDDGNPEPDEFINIQLCGLSVGTGFAIISSGSGTGSITIVDDDLTCPDPPVIANGMRTFTGNLVGDTATYTCNSSFELIGDPTTTCAVDAGGNSASFPVVPPPKCSPLCLDPPALPNAMVTFTGNSVNDTATYTCNSDFELIGDPTTTCTAASDWNSAAFPAVPPPMCRPLCPDPPALANATVTFTGNSVNDTATYTCDPGFDLIGDPTTTCTAALDRNSAAFLPVPPPMCRPIVTIGFTQGEYSVIENEGSVRVFIERDDVVLDRDILFTIFTIMGPGEAVAGEDYEAVAPTTLMFEMSMASDLLVGLDITILNDTVVENRECFYAVINSSDTSVIVDPAMARVCIDDDDSVVIEPEDPTYTVPEGPPNQYIDIPIVLIGMKEPGLECNVSVHTEDGSAIAGVDYIANWENFTFSAATTTQIFQVHIIDDLTPEPDEFFTVNVSSLDDNCLAGTPAIVTIIDDEDCDDMPCDPNADCWELPGPNNFTCECTPPFVGDGFTCRRPIVDVGDDPHFSIALPSGKLLCYTVQGEHGFTFNLISNKKIHMNAMFVPDSRREEVTWLGSMGIIIHSNSYKKSNGTALRFQAKANTIHIGDKIILKARNIEKLTFSDGKLTISEAPPVEGFKYPAVYVDLQDVGLSFTIKFMNEHLDLFWHSTDQIIGDSHGIIGQFFRKGVEIDEVRKMLIMPNKEPVPVMRRPVWSFMEREVADDQLCWTAMNPGYQGEGLIDGNYFDYLVNDVLTADFKFKKQQ